MSDLVLSCKALSKEFNDVGEGLRVLDEVNLEVRAGEIVAVVGQSGSGKSSLLHILGGLDSASSGEVHLAGHSFLNMNEAQRGAWRNQHLGFVYQFHHLLPEFSAQENVAMPLLLRRVPAAEAEAQAADMLEKVGLAKRLQHKPGELSGGERQRAAVARALVTNPACILADEPTGNLDSSTAEQVFELMLSLNRANSTSLIIVTHDRQLAGLADRVLELRNGQLRPQ